MHPLESGCPPDWADQWGEDDSGVWVGFTTREAVYRFRWVLPGRFWMGSPKGEAGRWSNEGPRHEVTISRGFWLGETPCTQALWSAVRGENPSRFVSPMRPVENVSWDDVQEFIGKLNQEVPGLEARLPTEAEWEYGCRAGTETSTYAGELKIEGENNAPILDSIAWYGGNSGADWDLEDGHDSTEWPQKQYEHTTAGTRIVRTKSCNDWGLFDMLGNVWEWCSDWMGEYSAETQVDPPGPRDGSLRVLRGGSWYFHARGVRTPAAATTTSVSVLPEVRRSRERSAEPTESRHRSRLARAGRAGRSAANWSGLVRMHFAVIPVFDSGPAEAELNRFLGSHRVVATERVLIADGQQSVWAICVSYIDASPPQRPGTKARIDYKEVLSDDDFQLFARLRTLRKELAEQESVPVYALFSNDQLAEMVTKRVVSASDLAAIDGVGEARIRKYGPAFLGLLREMHSPSNRSHDREDADADAKPRGDL